MWTNFKSLRHTDRRNAGQSNRARCLLLRLGSRPAEQHHHRACSPDRIQLRCHLPESDIDLQGGSDRFHANPVGRFGPGICRFASLLLAVRTEAVNLFQTLATGLLTVAGGDLDTFSTPFLGLDLSKQQKQVKVELVNVFLPLIAQKLSRQLVLQTLSAGLGADPVLTEALVTDAALLTDPSHPGKSLLGAFLALEQEGVSAFYYASTDGSGTAHASGTAATAATDDPSNGVPGTASAHFEGYLQVPPMALTDFSPNSATPTPLHRFCSTPRSYGSSEQPDHCADVESGEGS